MELHSAGSEGAQARDVRDLPGTRAANDPVHESVEAVGGLGVAGAGGAGELTDKELHAGYRVSGRKARMRRGCSGLIVRKVLHAQGLEIFRLIAATL